jgi:phospholipid/cholesterol/gamma-HCH transport system permease protein
MQTSIERAGSRAVVHVRGDLTVGSIASFYGALRGLRRRGIREVVLDLGEVERLDSAGVASVRVAERALRRAGKHLQIDHVADRHRAVLELVREAKVPKPVDDTPRWLERLGDQMFGAAESVRALGLLLADIARQSASVLARRSKLPRGAVATQVAIMGSEAMVVVGLLGMLIGMTIAFQAVMQLRQFGAQSFAGDMVGISVVRELAPMMTAIMLTGRTGAAIAAELGTMRVGGELDALAAMGISPVRFLVVPRLAALTVVQPALTLITASVAIAGSVLVAAVGFDMSPYSFWQHLTSSLQLGDFTLALFKSVVFAWVIGLSAVQVGLRALRDASAVGAATTRAVVIAIFSIVAVDALFATIQTVVNRP